MPASGSHRKAAYAAKTQGLGEPLLYSWGPVLGKTSRSTSKINRARKVLSKQNNDHNSASHPCKSFSPVSHGTMTQNFCCLWQEH